MKYQNGALFFELAHIWHSKLLSLERRQHACNPRLRACRLEWPRTTKPTLTDTLKMLGRLFNTYRHAWPEKHGARSPIRCVAIAS